jgi:hypothetical protein
MDCLTPVCLLPAAGNMSAAGLLQDPGSTVCMELGAGKAWLSAWLHMLHPATREFVLLDRLGNFANKVRSRHLSAWFVGLSYVNLWTLFSQPCSCTDHVQLYNAFHSQVTTPHPAPTKPPTSSAPTRLPPTLKPRERHNSCRLTNTPSFAS